MIHRSTFDFLRRLEENNTREWFDAHREEYDAMRANLADVAAELIASTGAVDARVREADLDPEKTLSRVFRDMRFHSEGKPPYKPEVFILLNGVGGTADSAGYYLHVAPGRTFAGGGTWMPERAFLDGIRRRISGHSAEWRGIVESDALRSTFPRGLTGPDPLKVAPRGYDVDDPAIEYLRMKGFAVGHDLSMRSVESDDAVEEITEVFRAAKPLVDFLNAARPAAEG